jgi:spermidine synthase
MQSFNEASDLAIRLDGLEEIESFDSAVQRLNLFRHPSLGLVFTINSELQHCEAWQALYHEPLVHVASSFVPELKHALILGGGSLFAAAELLRYPTLERCVLVDYDPAVLELMLRHYPHAQQVLADKRFVYICDDAPTYVSKASQSFDVIINDCLDLLAATLETNPSIFSTLSARLTSQGVCADVIYRHLLDAPYLARTKAAFATLGENAISLIIVPEYPGILHALTIWGSASVDQNAQKPRNKIQLSWYRDSERPPLQFYDPRFLAFHLYLPPFLRRKWCSSIE